MRIKPTKETTENPATKNKPTRCLAFRFFYFLPSLLLLQFDGFNDIQHSIVMLVDEQ
jgi:hypothetical protein